MQSEREREHSMSHLTDTVSAFGLNWAFFLLWENCV